MMVIPPESATILGRQAQACTTPVIARTSTAVTTVAWSRPCTARSTRMMAATTNHAQDRTEEPALRNTSRSLSGSLRDDACCDNTTGLQVRGQGRRTRGSTAAEPGRKPRACPLYARLAGSGYEPGLGAHAVRQPVGHRRAVGVQRRQCGGRHQPDPDADRALVHVEHGLVDVEVSGRPRGPSAQPGQAAGYRLQVPGEVLTAQALRARGDRLVPEH